MSGLAGGSPLPGEGSQGRQYYHTGREAPEDRVLYQTEPALQVRRQSFTCLLHNTLNIYSAMYFFHQTL